MRLGPPADKTADKSGRRSQVPENQEYARAQGFFMANARPSGMCYELLGTAEERHPKYFALPAVPGLDPILTLNTGHCPGLLVVMLFELLLRAVLPRIEERLHSTEELPYI